MPLYTPPEPFDSNVKRSSDLLRGEVTYNGQTWTFAAASAVIFVPFTVTRQFSAQRASVCNGTTASGNTRVGIYDSLGGLLASTPATAQSGTSAEQIISLSAAVTLGPGRYFMALSNSGTTGSYLILEVPLQISSSHGLRAAASGGIVTNPTIADPTTAHFALGLPVFSILGFASNELVAA